MTQARLLDEFLGILRAGEDLSPFQAIRAVHARGSLLAYLLNSRLGQYNRLYRAMEASLDLDLRAANVDDLEAIPGVGPKTARFFLLHTRPDQQIAVLDTHVLRHLRDKGLTTQVGTPPSGTKYDLLEKAFIGLAKASNMSIADYDLHIWRTYSGNTLP
jgi:thermostable 8-oxoguanine DNA glycosylase